MYCHDAEKKSKKIQKQILVSKIHLRGLTGRDVSVINVNLLGILFNLLSYYYLLSIIYYQKVLLKGWLKYLNCLKA